MAIMKLNFGGQISLCYMQSTWWKQLEKPSSLVLWYFLYAGNVKRKVKRQGNVNLVKRAKVTICSSVKVHSDPFYFIFIIC